MITLPFDFRLALHCFGLRLTVRLSTLGIIVFALAGVLSRLAADQSHALGPSGWIVIGVVAWVLIALALLGHEAVRVWLSRRLGVRVGRLDLFTFGGLPHSTEEATTPRSEVLVGVAGIISLLLAAGVVTAAEFATRGQPALIHLPLHVASWACLGLALLHLLPAPPLDGGRVLRAWLWYLTDDKIIGTRAVAIYAQLIGIGVIATGVLMLTREHAWPFWGVWLVVAGWQLAGAARAVLHRSLWYLQGHEVTLAQVAASSVHRLPATLTLDRAVDVLIDTDPRTAFLVTENNRPVGVFTMHQLRRVPRHAWDDHRLQEVMVPLQTLPALPADTPLNDAITRLDEEEHPLALVVESGTPIAVVTVEEILHHLVGHPK